MTQEPEETPYLVEVQKELTPEREIHLANFRYCVPKMTVAQKDKMLVELYETNLRREQEFAEILKRQWQL